jgi:hypothetical protein
MGLDPQAKAFLGGMEASGAPPLYELPLEEARGATGMITELIGAGPEVAMVEDFRCATSTGTIGARSYRERGSGADLFITAKDMEWFWTATSLTPRRGRRRTRRRCAPSRCRTYRRRS